VIDSPAVRIPGPIAAGEPPRTAFPVVATIAPVVVSVALFAVTGSPFMLLMAGLGPVIAVATFADGRRQRRRARRESAARFERELSAARDLAYTTCAAELTRRRSFASFEPAWGRGEATVVAVTRGDVPSGVELAGVDRADDDPALTELRREVAVLPGAPVLRPSAGSLAVAGPRVASAAVARTLALRLAARLSPAEATLVAPADERWTRSLPHAVDSGPPGAYRWKLVDRELSITWTAQPEPDAFSVEALRSDATTRPAAHRAASSLTDAAQSAGLSAPGGELPPSVALSTLLADAGLPRTGLSAPLGVDSRGAFILDLVADGPHAVVAGTTGSGKSELLVSWVLGMASGRSPADVSFVLVDFKGGAAFAPLDGLPHVLGTLSDLDERLAGRAIESLRAEVLRRERVLAAAGVRAIDELAPGVLARLVVVVDEFAALLAERSDLHALFADLAARGRSLGVHLVLCTQRPAGVVRDAVLANIAVRVALRVADRGDSLGLLGDDAAARLPASPKGRAVVVDGSGVRRTVQIALADTADVARLAAVTPAGDVPRPWCDPLPAVVPHGALPPAGEGIPFGLLDLPAEQRQPTAVLRPRDGHLLVLGAPGAGRTTALASLAAGAGEAARWLPADPVGLWAVLSEADALPDGALLLADDLDLTLARSDSDHAVELADLVARLLREAPARGIRVAASARRLAAPVHALAPLFGSRLLLRLGGRDEHVLAGGDGALFDPRASPGAGSWEGAAVQVALPADTVRRELAVPPPVVARVPVRGELAIVAARPGELVGLWDRDRVRVRVLGVPDDGPTVDPGRTVVLGDPDAWQADWAELARARRELPLVVHGCPPADLRTLTRSRGMPPPLRDGEVWLVEQGRVRRAVLDIATDG
jgi:DNA segregation ATPase FtsK/SpoIIIE, S-DNA-T family